MQPPADANDPLKLVAAGQADAAISYQRQVIQSKAQGIPVVSLAAIVRHPLNQVMVRADTGVKSPKDLAGLTVGYASSDIDVSLVKSMIAYDGGNPESVKFVDIGYDLLASMLTKKVDAIIGGYINHEKLLIEKNGMAITLLDPVQFGAPDNYELVLITGEQQAKEKLELLKAFWDACAKAQKEVTADPQAGLATLLKQEMQEFPLEQEVEAKSLEILLPLMNPAEGAFGVQDAAQWQSVIDWMKQTKHIDQDLKAANLFQNF
jgi:putative hydroxymethylpyrimidine transport system substrate-binding protein